MSSNPNWWMDYMPDFMSPGGMIFYSFIVFVLISIHNAVKRRTVEQYVDKSLRQNMQKTLV